MRSLLFVCRLGSMNVSCSQHRKLHVSLNNSRIGPQVKVLLSHTAHIHLPPVNSPLQSPSCKKAIAGGMKGTVHYSTELFSAACDLNSGKNRAEYKAAMTGGTRLPVALCKIAGHQCVRSPQGAVNREYLLGVLMLHRNRRLRAL